jgi:putative transposase
MKKKRYTEEQIVRILKEIESGAAVAEVARRYGVSEATLFRWKKKYAGLNGTELKRLKALEEENRRLKKIVAQQAMDNDILRELLSKNW